MGHSATGHQCWQKQRDERRGSDDLQAGGMDDGVQPATGVPPDMMGRDILW